MSGEWCISCGRLVTMQNVVSGQIFHYNHQGKMIELMAEFPAKLCPLCGSGEYGEIGEVAKEQAVSKFLNHEETMRILYNGK